MIVPASADVVGVQAHTPLQVRLLVTGHLDTKDATQTLDIGSVETLPDSHAVHVKPSPRKPTSHALHTSTVPDSNELAGQALSCLHEHTHTLQAPVFKHEPLFILPG